MAKMFHIVFFFIRQPYIQSYSSMVEYNGGHGYRNVIITTFPAMLLINCKVGVTEPINWLYFSQVNA